MSADPVAISDVELESKIDAEYRRMVNSVQEPERIAAWHRMVALVRQRSPDAIKRMERERKLRR